MRYTQQNLPNIIKATGRQRLMGKSWANFKQNSSIRKGYSIKRVVNKHMYGQMQRVKDNPSLTSQHQ